jgi:hypothetical protein
MIAHDSRSIARSLESLIGPILAFEGESMPALTAGRGAELAETGLRDTRNLPRTTLLGLAAGAVDE